MKFFIQTSYGTILQCALKLQHLCMIICLLSTFSQVEAKEVRLSSEGLKSQIPLNNGKYQVTFVFKNFSKSSYSTPMSVMAEHEMTIDDLRKYAPSQSSESFYLAREIYVSDGSLDLEFSSTTTRVFLTMLIKKATNNGSAPPPSSPTPPTADTGLPWLEDFNAADGSYKGSTETSQMYTNGILKSKDGKLVARGVGQAAYKSEVISLQGNTVDVSLELSSLGNLEAGYDDVKVYYRLDNGSEILAGKASGNIAGNKVVSVKGLKANSLQVVVRIKNSDITEHYFIDNVHVKLTTAGTDNQQSTPPVTASNEIYQINFNADNAAAISGWNHFNTIPTAGKKISLKNSKNESSPVSMTLGTSWDDHNNKGYNSGSNTGLYPDAVMKTYYCTNSQERIHISGLDKNKKYQFTFFASSMYDVDRTTEYVIGTQKVTLNAARNKHLTVTLQDVSPDSQGNIVVEVRKASGAYRGFINSLIIQATGSTNAKINSTLTKAQHSEEPISDIREIESAVSFKIYPNPVRDQLHIETQEEGQYSLYNTQGSMIMKGAIKPSVASSITVSGLQHGTYYLHFITPKNSFIEKLIIHP